MTAPLFVALALAALAPAGERWPRPDRKLVLGPLTVEVYLSPTAHVFHLVDQLSGWDDACHAQYRRAYGDALTEEDEALLARHAELRQGKRWGQGLEQTFYVPLDLDDAIAAGRKAGHLSAEEARVLRPVLEHFLPRAEAMLAERRELMSSAFDGLDREAFTHAAHQLAGFCRVRKLTVLAFPIASPEPGGGGMDGDRLRWEVCDGDLPWSVLLHELVHGFCNQRRDLLQEWAQATPGLNLTLLGEGFAYGVAPGLYPFADGDPLAHDVAQDRCGSDRWDGRVGYGQQRMYGLALRPLLAEALDSGQTIDDFMPRARDAFLAVDAVMMAEENRPPTLFMAGPGRDAVRERLRDSKYHLSMYRFNHGAEEHWRAARERGRGGDLFVALFAGDDDDWDVPRDHRDLLPIALDDVRARVRARRTVEAEGRHGRLRVVVLAAPTTDALRELVETSALLVEPGAR